jgi:hypothetical protein
MVSKEHQSDIFGALLLKHLSKNIENMPLDDLAFISKVIVNQRLNKEKMGE